VVELFDVAVADALAVVTALVVADCVGAALVGEALVPAAFVLLVGVGVLVATGVAESTAAGTDAGTLAGAPIAPVLTAPVPPKFNELVDDNCGGVIASTAPRPPKVPPAINSARFIFASIPNRSNASCAYMQNLTASTCELAELNRRLNCEFYSL
jgi:hypothetical protein